MDSHIGDPYMAVPPRKCAGSLRNGLVYDLPPFYGSAPKPLIVPKSQLDQR